jgi:hypothetical protein
LNIYIFKRKRKERECSVMGNTLGTWGINWEHNNSKLDGMG